MQKIHSYRTKLITETEIFQLENWSNLLLKFSSEYSSIIWIIDETFQNNEEFNSLKNTIYISGGDICKSLDSYQSILSKLKEIEVDRKSILIAVGGGSISDLVGFVAATYLRGIDFAIVPTTILSIIDASIGGKNGINFLNTKNQIGTIYQPRFIINYLPFLDSLPIEEISDGFAEIIKYGLISNRDFYNYLSEHAIDDFNSNPEFRNKLIETCIKQKSIIVEEDTFEKDKRRILNFGHTVGHCIESLYGLSHGKSVAIGMLFAVKLSEKINNSSTQVYIDLQILYKKYNLPTQVENFDIDKIYSKLISDKKKEADFIHFVLLKKIGDVEVVKIKLTEINYWLEIAKKEAWI
jgi:3-dehydroquinate synthase